MSNDLNELILDVREHVRLLAELGVESLAYEPPALNLQAPVVVTASAQAPVQPVVQVPVPRVAEAAPKTETPAVSRIPGSRLRELPSLSNRKVSPPAARQTPVKIAPAAPAGQPSNAFAGGETIQQIRAEIGECLRCPLSAERTQVVHSTGNLDADLMFVGEAPGADEDIQGLPFVGRAGKLLTDIIAAIGFSREQVFIGNINRCRPPGNRQPVPIETEACRPFLLREIAIVRPKVIVVLGNTATQNLLQIKTPISKLRGNFQDYFGVKVMPTFHPAYLLRDPHKKRDVWEDMKKVRDFLAQS